MSVPYISVCVPVYNRANYLRACIWSILRQTCSDFELLICDDNSQEDLRSVCSELADKRIKYIRHSRNLGTPANYIYAAAMAQGKFLKFVDSDDLILPDCLERCVSDIKSSGAEAVLYKTAVFTDAGIEHFGTYSLPAHGLVKGASWSTDKALLDFHNAQPTAMFLNREAFWRAGGYDVSLKVIYDWEFYTRFLEKGGHMFFVDDVRAINRQHEGNLARTGAHSGRVLSDVLTWRRRTNLGRRRDYHSLVFDQLRQCQIAGTSTLPVISVLFQYGYVVDSILGLPILAARRLLRRLTPAKPPRSEFHAQIVTQDNAALEEKVLETLRNRPEGSAFENKDGLERARTQN